MASSVAEAYEAMLVPGIFEPWATLIVESAEVSPGMMVLDAGCGTGVATKYAARLCGPGGKAIGIDLDEGMVGVARVTSKRIASAEYRCASATELPFGMSTFDAAVCLQSFQYFSDASKAMHELHRVMRSGATLCIATWSALETCKGHWALVTALERRKIDAAAARKPLCLPDDGKLGATAEFAGFRQVTTRVENRFACFASVPSFVDAIARGAPSSRLALEQVPAEQWPEFLEEISELLDPWLTDSGLLFPMESNLLTARR